MAPSAADGPHRRTSGSTLTPSQWRPRESPSVAASNAADVGTGSGETHLMTSLDGKAVVVTGAGRGLGEAFAVQLGLAGAMVVVNDVDGDSARRTAAEIRAQGHPAVASDHSVSDPEQA